MNKFKILIFIMLFASIMYSQSCPTVGNLQVSSLTIGPSSTLRECNKARVEAYWISINSSNTPYDADLHESTLLVALPNQLIGTSGTLEVIASDGNTYWNSTILLDNEAKVKLTGVIPVGVSIGILISDMTVKMNDTANGFEQFNYTMSVSNAVSDCDPNDDEQSNTAAVVPGNSPYISNHTVDCAASTLNVDPNKGDGTVCDNCTFSWEGPNGFTATTEDITFSEDGDYTVTITDQHKCDSTFTYTVACSPAPIKLLFFLANGNGFDAELAWTTVSETNNSSFAIERSADGRNWSQIGSVKGNGTSVQKNDYRYTDIGIGNELSKVYYRLKQVDYDGKYEYSPTQMVRFNTDKGVFDIYPNPSVGEVVISGINADSNVASIKVYNQLGQLVLEDTPSDNVYNWTELHSGVYTVNLLDANETIIFTDRLLIAK